MVLRLVLAVAVMAAVAAVSGGVKDMSLDDLKKPIELTPKTYEDLVLKHKMTWIVAFQGADADSSDLDDLAKRMEGLFFIGKVNVDKHPKILTKLNIPADNVPKYRVYPFGEDNKDQFQDAETLDAAVEKAREVLPSLVETLHVDTEVQQFLVKALQGGRVPVITFTNKPGVPDLLVKTSVWFDEQFLFAVFPDADEATQQRFGVKSLPQLQLMVPQPGKNPGEVQFGASPYDKKQFGALKFKNVIKYLAMARMELEKAGMMPKKPQADEQQPPPAASNFKPEALFELSASTPDACSDSKLGMCIVSFLDGSPLNEEKKKEQQDILKEVQKAAALKGRPLHYMWVDLTCHPEFGAKFNVGPELAPTVVAFSAKQKKFAQHVGTFTTKAISQFILSVLGGRISMGDVQGGAFPAVSDTNCATFHAQNMPVEEEEFDLSDIMGDDFGDDDKKAEEVVDQAALDSAKEAHDAAEKAEREAKMRIAQAEIDKLNKKAKKGKKKKGKKKVKDEL